MEKKVSIIIPNWNGLEHLKVNLESVTKLVYTNFEVIIVDNGSADNSVNYIKSNYKAFKVLELEENTGFANAINQGIKIALGEYIALLNNDTEVDSNWLNNLIKPFEYSKDIAVVTSKLLNYFQREKVDSAGDEMNIVGQARSRGYGEDSIKWDKAEYVFSATGGASIYKKDLFHRVGLFENTLFMYFEDTDFCYRLQKQGYKVWYEPSAIVYHKHRASSNKRKDFLEYLLYRNFIIFYIINTPTPLFFKRYSLLKFGLVVVHTYYFLSKTGYSKQAFEVILWFAKNIRTVFKLRKERNSLRLSVSYAYLDKWRIDKKLKILNIEI